ncbi:polysaccharide pyruvyl transferase family protein [Pseudoalteromonas fuliginea]|uniref:polysaccharide pyruvyl transferase family protein n=1 Tax=Pseudoalteromonas fuliginea TaxID=1872678 RepID=UPI0031748D9E
MNVLVNGFFPDRNFGDDLFLKFSTYYCKNPAIRNIEKDKRNFFQWLLYLYKLDCYIWLGGTFIDKDSTLKTILSMLFEFSLLKLFNVKLEFKAVGFSSEVDFFKFFSQKYIVFISNSLSVRDIKSYKFCENYNSRVVLVKDLVLEHFEDYMGDDIFLDKPTTDDFRYSTLVCLDKEASIPYASKVKNEVSNLNFFTIQIASPYVKDRQELISKKFIKQLVDKPKFKLTDYQSAGNVLHEINQSQLIITDRLHVAICAVLLKRKVYLIAVSEKLKTAHLLFDNDVSYYLKIIKAESKD